MRDRKKLIIFVLAFISLIVLYFGLFHEDSKKFNWKEDFVLDKERPYGTWLVTELLKEYDSKRKFIIPSTPVDRSLVKADNNSNYIFIGSEIYLENSALDSLIAYVEKGNNAFIFTRSYPEEILEKTKTIFDVDTLNHWYSFFYGDSSEAWVLNHDAQGINKIELPYRSKYKSSAYDWNYLTDELYAHDFEVLGEFASKNNENSIEGINFFKVDYGKGVFYFHTQPILFTNIVLKEGEMLSYANEVFANLNSGEIIWEEYNWRFNKPNTKTWLFKPNFFQRNESPLKMIFSSKALKWAWYILLIFILIFVIFNGKRRKSTIDVLPDKRNTSLSHIKTLSKLYSKKNDRYTIAAKLFENLLWYIQTELRLNINEKREKLIEHVIVRTRIPEDEVKSIFNSWENIQNKKEVSVNEFIAFNKEIDNFYRRLKE